ncbi:MAG: hypothetical protein D6719_10865 [Candidatus Dadabacteria bacterium]|nr:MAG: hypothetical protein D6719_10865 [Candidatus Dadabacteria bacterium]
MDDVTKDVYEAAANQPKAGSRLQVDSEISKTVISEPNQNENSETWQPNRDLPDGESDYGPKGIEFISCGIDLFAADGLLLI